MHIQYEHNFDEFSVFIFQRKSGITKNLKIFLILQKIFSPYKNLFRF